LIKLNGFELWATRAIRVPYNPILVFVADLSYRPISCRQVLRDE